VEQHNRPTPLPAITVHAVMRLDTINTIGQSVGVLTAAVSDRPAVRGVDPKGLRWMSTEVWLKDQSRRPV
jgi:hypothetical protein